MSIAAPQGAGRQLAELLGLEIIGTEGHDCKGPCIACKSSDAFRVHHHTGVSFCHSCKGDWSPFELAEKILGDRAAAMRLLVQVGLAEDHGPNGHTNGTVHSALELVARQKGVTAESLRAFGAVESKGAVGFPMYGPNGQPCSTFTLRPGNGKGLNEKGKPTGLFWAKQPEAGESRNLCEGVKDGAAWHGLGFSAVGLPSSTLSARFARLFAGVDVVIAPDRDSAGEQGAQKTARVLYGVANSVRIATLPAEFKESKGDDVRDVLRKDGGVDLVRHSIADARLWEPAATDEPGAKPTIIITTNEPAVIDKAIACLKADEGIYTRGGMLVKVVRDQRKNKRIDRPTGSPRIVPLSLPSLRERLSGCASFAQIKQVGDNSVEQPCHPPEWLVKAVDARGEWPDLRPLDGIVEAPTMRPDGTILDTPGYDEQTALLYEPSCEFPPVPAHPNRADATVAAQSLLEVIVDFPMQKPSHRSAWLASQLTALAPRSFEGPAPLTSIEANVAGAGKGLSVDGVAIIATGRAIARVNNPDDNAEMRKLITSLTIEGQSLALFDTVENTLGCPALNAALTATTWQDRVLGTNKSTGPMPLVTTWFATGNNIQYDGDTTRRCLRIRLESPEENPEERTDFHHPDLLLWIRENRPRLVVAGLTILRAYCAAGRPPMGLKPWGSYEGWGFIRDAIVFAGQPDPAATREEMRKDCDKAAAALRGLIAGWREVTGFGGMTVGEVYRELSSRPNHYHTLRDAIADLMPSKPGHLPSARSLGMKLHHLKGRVVGGMAFSSTQEKAGAAVWEVVEIGQGNDSEGQGTKGTRGTIPTLRGCAGARSEQHRP